MKEKTLERLKVKQHFRLTVRELPVWQNALFAFTFWFWLSSMAGDFFQVLGYDKFEIDYLVGFFFGLFLFALAFLMPLSFALWGVQHVYEYLKNRKSDDPFYKHMIEFSGWIISASMLIVAPFLLLLIVDLEAITLVPFLTTAGALLWLGIGLNVTKNLPVRKRLIVVPLTILLILSVEYIDWNSRKPFLRDLYTVKVGMTGADVKNLMGKYHKHAHKPESLTYEYLQPDFTGEEFFRHTNKSYGNADIGSIKFQDGRVIQVGFSHD
jgi:hypothetical protein